MKSHYFVWPNLNYLPVVGVAIGNGVYFAVSASYSAGGYSAPDSRGHKHIYLSRVLTGEFTTGKHGMVAPPAKSADILYDSVADNPSSPGVFVVFHDAAAYPEYLIKFTWVIVMDLMLFKEFDLNMTAVEVNFLESLRLFIGELDNLLLTIQLVH